MSADNLSSSSAEVAEGPEAGVADESEAALLPFAAPGDTEALAPSEGYDAPPPPFAVDCTPPAPCVCSPASASVSASSVESVCRSAAVGPSSALPALLSCGESVTCSCALCLGSNSPPAPA